MTQSARTGTRNPRKFKGGRAPMTPIRLGSAPGRPTIDRSDRSTPALRPSSSPGAVRDAPQRTDPQSECRSDKGGTPDGPPQQHLHYPRANPAGGSGHKHTHGSEPSFKTMLRALLAERNLSILDQHTERNCASRSRTDRLERQPAARVRRSPGPLACRHERKVSRMRSGNIQQN